MSLLDTIIRVNAKGNDIHRRLLMSSEAVCYLLKRKGETGTKWTVVQQITSGWDVKYNDYRAQMVLSIATSTANFEDLMAQTSYIAYGIPASGSVDVYSIDPDRRDVVPPTGESPFWKVYVTRDGKERFTIPS